MPNGAPSMTRMHFQAIAEVIRDGGPWRGTPRDVLIKRLSSVLPSGLKTRFVTEIVNDLPADGEGRLLHDTRNLAHAFARGLSGTNWNFDQGRFVAVATGEQAR